MDIRSISSDTNVEENTFSLNKIKIELKRDKVTDKVCLRGFEVTFNIPANQFGVGFCSISDSSFLLLGISGGFVFKLNTHSFDVTTKQLPGSVKCVSKTASNQAAVFATCDISKSCNIYILDTNNTMCVITSFSIADFCIGLACIGELLYVAFHDNIYIYTTEGQYKQTIFKTDSVIDGMTKGPHDTLLCIIRDARHYSCQIIGANGVVYKTVSKSPHSTSFNDNSITPMYAYIRVLRSWYKQQPQHVTSDQEGNVYILVSSCRAVGVSVIKENTKEPEHVLDVAENVKSLCCEENNNMAALLSEKKLYVMSLLLT